MSAEPLTAEQLGRIAASAAVLAQTWAAHPEMVTAHLTMAEWGARIAREDVPALLAEVARLSARVAELEPPTAECQHESPFGRLCDLPVGHVGDHQRGDGADFHSWMRATARGAR